MSSPNQPEKTLLTYMPYRAGRDAKGRVAIRHRGGRHKRRFRLIDFKRNKNAVPGKVERIEYDPNRGADIALIIYRDGEKRYILAPVGLKAGQTVISGEKAPYAVGNALPLSLMPIGAQVHNIELHPGAGGIIARGAGNYASVLTKEEVYARLKMPSGEIRLFDKRCLATVGQLSNVDRKHRKLAKAGTKRHLGIRPTVRGTAQNPASHPHGGGEGRSGIGMPSPKSPWGKPTLGKRTRSRKLNNKFIVSRRSK